MQSTAIAGGVLSTMMMVLPVQTSAQTVPGNPATTVGSYTSVQEQSRQFEWIGVSGSDPFLTGNYLGNWNATALGRATALNPLPAISTLIDNVAPNVPGWVRQELYITNTDQRITNYTGVRNSSTSSRFAPGLFMASMPSFSNDTHISTISILNGNLDVAPGKSVYVSDLLLLRSQPGIHPSTQRGVNLSGNVVSNYRTYLQGNINTGGLVNTGTIRTTGQFNLANGNRSEVFIQGASEIGVRLLAEGNTDLIFGDINGNSNFTTKFIGTLEAATGKDITLKAGNGLFIYTGPKSLALAGLTVASGTLQIGDGGTSGELPVDTGKQLMLATGSRVVFNRSDSMTVGAIITGGGGLTKKGAGTLTLTGGNAYTGSTVVEAGTLKIGTGGSLDAQSLITVMNGAIFDFGTINNPVVGSLGGTDGALAGGTGDLTVHMANGATDTFTGSNPFGGFNRLVLSGNGTLTLAGNLNSAKAIVVTGGTLNLAGNNTLTGGITVIGKLVLGSSSAAGGAGNTILTTGSVIDYAAGINNAAPITIGSNTTQLQVLTGAATQSGIISESQAGRPLEKIGTGVLILGADNTYSGTTRITSGALNVRTATGLGTTASGTEVAAGAALELQQISGNFLAIGREALTLNGTGISGTGALRGVSGTIAYDGGITLGSNSSITSSAGSLQLFGDIALSGHELTFGGAGRIDVNSKISGNGSVVVDGTTVWLRDINFYAGQTRLNSGELNVSGSGLMGLSSNALVVNGGVLSLDRLPTPGTINRFVVGSLSGSGGTVTNMASSGPVELVVDGSSSTTYAGALRDTTGGALRVEFKGGGTTTLTGPINLSDGLKVAGAGTRVNFGASSGGTLDQKITGRGSIDVGAGATIAFSHNDIATISSQIAGAGTLVKLGSGQLTLNNLQGFTGAINVDAGILELGSFVTLAPTTVVTVVAGAGFRYGSNLQFSQLTGAPIGQDNIVVSSMASETFAGNISGARTLKKDGAGTLTLSGVQSYTGLTTVSGGTLELMNANNVLTGGIIVNGRLVIGATGAAGGAGNTITTTGSTVSIANGTNNATPIIINSDTTRIEVAGNDSAIQSGVISELNGPRPLEKIGTGTLTFLGGGPGLSLSNSYSGPTTISAGTLTIDNTRNLGNDSATNRLIFNGGKLDSRADITMARSVSVGAAGGTVQAEDNTGPLQKLVFANGIQFNSSTLTKTGRGQLHVSGVGSGTGELNVNDGSLFLNSSAALGAATLRFSGIGIRILSTDATTPVTFANAVTADTSVLVSNATGTDLTLSGAISGSGAVQKTNFGALQLTGNNSFSGGFSLGAGIVGVGSNTALGTGMASVQTGTTLKALAGVTLANDIVMTPGAFGLPNQFNVDTSGFNMTLSGIISTNVPANEPGNVQPGLTKDGAGTLTLTGANTYRGPTNVNAGKLIVNGSIANTASVTIANGAVFGGNSAIPNLNVQTGATLSPGNSIGTVNIAGDMTLNAGSTTVIEIQQGLADRINAGGTAALAGTLNLVALGGPYVFAAPYTIITAAGGRAGTFGTINTDAAFGVGVTSTVTYRANDVQVTLNAAPLVQAPVVQPPVVAQPVIPAAPPADPVPVAAPPPPAVVPAAPPAAAAPAVLQLTRPMNVRAVAAALDRVVAGGNDPSAFFGVYNQPTVDRLTAAVNTLSGEVHTASSAIAMRASDQFLRVMLDPFAIGRDGELLNSGGAAQSISTAWRALAEPSRIGGTLTPFLALAPAPAQRFVVWGAAYGQTARGDGEAASTGSSRLSSSDGHIAAGIDYGIMPGLIAGVAVSGGQGSASLGNGLGSARAEIYQAGVYTMGRLGALSFGLSASYGSIQTETSRAIPALNLYGIKADYRSESWSGRAEMSYAVARLAGLSLSPTAAVQVQNVRMPGFVEVNGAGMPAGVMSTGKTNNTVRSEVGMKLDYATMLGGSEINLYARASWAHYFSRDARFSGSLVGLAGSAFTVEGARPPRDAALLAIGSDMKLGTSIFIGGQFDTEQSATSRTYSGSAKLRVAF